jgi:predicted outer membrane repeat protein
MRRGAVRVTDPEEETRMPRVRAFAGAAVTVAAVTAAAAVPAAAMDRGGRQVRCDAGALVQAIRDANTVGGGALTLARGCTYTLTSPDNIDNGLPVITSRIAIYGSGSTIKRSTWTGTPEFRIFSVDGPQGNLTLTDLTVRDGRAPGAGDGGGILVDNGGELALDKVEITKNSATGDGGGIAGKNSRITLRNSVLSDNTAAGGDGGGMHQAGGIARFWNSAVTGNAAFSNGGGINASGSNTTTLLEHTQVTENAAARNGGGIHSFTDPMMTLKSTQVTGNTAGALGGGVYGNATISGGRVAHNSADDGGGLYVSGRTRTTLDDTFVYNNTASGGRGGGILNTTLLELNRSHIHANHAPNGTGGGLANQGGTANATLRNSSVTYNVAATAPGGIFNEGTVTLIYTPVVNNLPTNCQGSPVPVPGCAD